MLYPLSYEAANGTLEEGSAREGAGNRRVAHARRWTRIRVGRQAAVHDRVSRDADPS